MIFFWTTQLVVNTMRTRTPISQVHVCARAKSLQLCSTLCDPKDCSPAGSSVHGHSPGKNTGVGCHALLQGSSPPRNPTWVSCMAGRFFTTETWGKISPRYRGEEIFFFFLILFTWRHMCKFVCPFQWSKGTIIDKKVSWQHFEKAGQTLAAPVYRNHHSSPVSHPECLYHLPTLLIGWHQDFTQMDWFPCKAVLLRMVSVSLLSNSSFLPTSSPRSHRPTKVLWKCDQLFLHPLWEREEKESSSGCYEAEMFWKFDSSL